MKVHFLLRIYNSDHDSHLSAYWLDVTDNIVVKTVEQLLDCYPLSAYVVGLNRFVVLKNFVYSHTPVSLHDLLLYCWLVTMSKRLLVTVPESTKVITVDGSVNVNILKEVIYCILYLFI